VSIQRVGAGHTPSRDHPRAGDAGAVDNVLSWSIDIERCGDSRAVNVYEASVRGEMSSVLSDAFTGCEVAPRRGTTTLRFSPEKLREVLDSIQDFGLVLIDLRLLSERGGLPIGE